MLKKMMLMLAVICSMIWSVNAQEVTETLEKALNDPQDSSKQEKNAELKEIDKENAEQVKKDEALLKNDTASKINAEVNKEVAEDEAIADTEDSITDETDAETVEEDVKPTPEEPEVEEDTGSWFGWLWPFGGDDDETVAAETEEEPVAEAIETEEVTETPEETVKTEEITETPEAVETTTEDITITEGADEPEVAEELAQPEEDQSGVNVVNKLIYYFPNLFLNLIDSFTASVGVGAKSSLELSMTRYAQIGGSYGDAFFLEKGIYRRYGGGYENGSSLKLGPLMSETRYIDNVIGNTPFRIIKQPSLKMQRPTNLIYKEKYRNFWTVGIDVGWLINIGLHFEPVEFADFITGIFFYDLCDDDLGRTVNEKKNDDALEADSTMDEKAEELDNMEDTEDAPADITEEQPADITEDIEVEDF